MYFKFKVNLAVSLRRKPAGPSKRVRLIRIPEFEQRRRGLIGQGRRHQIWSGPVELDIQRKVVRLNNIL